VSATDDLEIGVGALIIVATLYDLFQSVVVPRPAVGRVRFSSTLVRRGWRLWRSVATRPRRLQTREAALAVFGPLAIVVLLIIWGFALILGYGLVLYGLRTELQPQPGSFATTLYFSAGTMLSFSAQGIEPTGVASRILTTFQAANGFALFALVISLLFSLFSAFQRREAAVVALDALAGAPPSGVQLLEACARDDMPDQLVATFEEWRVWTVDVLETHLAFPLLFYFRSSHDNEAWPNSFGAVQDAATLVLSTIEGGPIGQARLLHKVGIHLVQDARESYGYNLEMVPGVEREEFVEAYDRLDVAGYRLRDVDLAWAEFNQLRGGYISWLNRLTMNLSVPPAPWIGDRSYLPHRERAPKAPESDATKPRRRHIAPRSRRQ
jgi:hypothetical protein